MRHLISSLQVLLLLSILAPGPVAADGNAALLELLEALYRNGTIDAETYGLVRTAARADDGAGPVVAADPGTQASPRTDAGAAAPARQTPVVAAAPATDAAAPSGRKLKIGGRIQTDAALYFADHGRHGDGSEARRARIALEGELPEQWNYKLEYDFTTSGIAGIQDAFLEYGGFNPVSIRVGHFKEPFSLQNLTGANNTLFMERALPQAFAPGRNIGLQARHGGANWSIAAGVFGTGIDNAAGGADEGYGLSGRAIWTPVAAAGRAWHLGLSATHRITGSDDVVRFRERPESHATDTRIVDSGDFDGRHLTRMTVESAVVYGPFSLAGEYYRTWVRRALPGMRDPGFSGFYIESGWFLTGESMNYRAASGSFSKISPHAALGGGGFGAWQAAFRFSSIDLNDADINGGEAQSLTLGLNWYATPDIRFSANYVNILDIDGGPMHGESPDVFQVRAQVVF
jgi:phosphate-selective porin OprO/OprP